MPDWLLDARTRAEKAFISCVAEAYVRGVSTRRVEGLVETLGIASLSKSQVSEMAKDLDVMVEEMGAELVRRKRHVLPHHLGCPAGPLS